MNRILEEAFKLNGKKIWKKIKFKNIENKKFPWRYGCKHIIELNFSKILSELSLKNMRCETLKTR